MNDSFVSTRLIITADDFGRSSAINQAVAMAVSRGVLTSASLMVVGNAFDEAVRIATKELPNIHTGLHLTLTELTPLLGRQEVPRLVNKKGAFFSSPAKTGIFLQLSKKMQNQMNKEIAAQFERYEDTHLKFFHVNTHHHIHLHPVVFAAMLRYVLFYKVRAVRIPYEPWYITGSICTKHQLRNLFYRTVFYLLCLNMKQQLKGKNIKFCQGVFGLYATGEVTEQWLLKFLDRIKLYAGIYELYLHPTCDKRQRGYQELQALLSTRVRDRIEEFGVELVSHNDI